MLFIVMTFSRSVVVARTTTDGGWEELKVVGKSANKRRGLGQGLH